MAWFIYYGKQNKIKSNTYFGWLNRKTTGGEAIIQILISLLVCFDLETQIGNTISNMKRSLTLYSISCSQFPLETNNQYKIKYLGRC
jgi:hypothetical protein